MLVEIFKDVNGFNRYTISNMGNVFDKKRKIFIKPCIDNGYYRFSMCNDDNCWKRVLQHRLIGINFIDNPNNYDMIDHIDHDKLNNDIKNLRWCNNQMNQMNKKKQKNMSCDFKGVYKHKKKYQTAIKYENISYYIGSFGDALTAGYAYNVAAKLLFKKFAFLNLIEPPENYLQIKYLVFYKLSKHFDNIDHLVEKYKQFI